MELMEGTISGSDYVQELFQNSHWVDLVRKIRYETASVVIYLTDINTSRLANRDRDKAHLFGPTPC